MTGQTIFNKTNRPVKKLNSLKLAEGQESLLVIFFASLFPL